MDSRRFLLESLGIERHIFQLNYLQIYYSDMSEHIFSKELLILHNIL